MQHCDTSVRTNEDLENPCREGATQALEQILSCGLPILYRQAYRLLGTEPTPRMLSIYSSRRLHAPVPIQRAVADVQGPPRFLLALLNFVEMLITLLPTREKIGIGTAFATAC